MAAPTHAQTDVTALLGELNAGEQVIYFRADYPYNRPSKPCRNWWPTAGR